MSEKIVKSFSVKHLQVIDENGKADARLMPKLSTKQFLELYEWMVLCRRFDEKALSLQRQGRLGTYASVLGQEASQIGAAYALGKGDWVFPTYRDASILIVRGQPMVRVFQYFGGDERGSIPLKGVNNFPISIPVGTQGIHAVGAAMAATIQQKKFATLACFGDGASSEGDMNEAFNFAGVFKAPVVFLCQNNQWAISVPVKQQTAAETIAQKAIAFGFEGVQVDGNDVLAVYAATAAALKKAYAGKGPTLIECLTYRVNSHTTSDDASKYRSPAEVEVWKKRDPILRMRKFLEAKKLWNVKKEAALLAKVDKQVSSAVNEYESIPKPDVDDVFKYQYSDMPKFLQEQMDDYKRLIEGK